ncbi:MAG: peroxiredoxin [delta proteobacterium ML8_F1]|nr:MAG: peroxiredoxin [delta proteobacterium ML8_F1]
MGEAFKPGCRPPVAVNKAETDEKPVLQAQENANASERRETMVKVGKPAPDFTLNAFHKGEFKQYSLSEFKGKWVLLCFYPGDFTFV